MTGEGRELNYRDAINLFVRDINDAGLRIQRASTDEDSRRPGLNLRNISEYNHLMEAIKKYENAARVRMNAFFEEGVS